jgi:hypothetical protein
VLANLPPMVKRLKHLFQESQSRSPNPNSLASAWAWLGDKDRAPEWLGREYAERSEARCIDEKTR